MGGSWTDCKSKKLFFWSVIFSYFTQQQRTISWSAVTCKEKWILWQPATTSSVARPRRSSKAPPKARLAPKKSSWSLFDGLLPVWSTTAFWILQTPLHLRSMLSKLMGCVKNCNAYNWHLSTERAQFFSTIAPDRMSHIQHFKSWTNWTTKFCLIRHIHLPSRQPTTTSSCSRQLFAGKTLLQPERRNCFPRVHRIPRHRFLCYRNKLISCWQNCVDCNGSYFD